MAQATMAPQFTGIHLRLWLGKPGIGSDAQCRRDAYRAGDAVMMGEIMQVCQGAQAFPGSLFWRILAFTRRMLMVGMGLHDTIQPGFSFRSASRCLTPLPAAPPKGRASRDNAAHQSGEAWCLFFLAFSCVHAKHADILHF